MADCFNHMYLVRFNNLNRSKHYYWDAPVRNGSKTIKVLDHGFYRSERQYSTEEKIRIVLGGLRGESSIAELGLH